MNQREVNYIYRELQLEIKSQSGQAWRACSTAEFAHEVGGLPEYGGFIGDETTSLADIADYIEFTYRDVAPEDFKQLADKFQNYFFTGWRKSRARCLQYGIPDSEIDQFINAKYLMAKILADSFHQKWQELEYPPLPTREPPVLPRETALPLLA